MSSGDKSYPGNIEKRGSSYRVRLSVNGERHRYTLSDAEEEDAEEFARTKYDELRKRARRLGTTRSPSLSSLLDRFENTEIDQLAEASQRAYEYAIQAARTYFVELGDDPSLEEVRSSDVKQFLDWRRRHGPDGSDREERLANVTIKRTRAVLHRVFEYADQLELRDGNPVSRVEAPKVEDRNPVILTSEQYDKLLAKARERDEMLWAYTLVLGEAGLRSQSEALWLQWEDLHFEDSFLWVESGRGGHRTKSGEGRWVPMTDRLREGLREYAATYRLQVYDGSRSPWVFHSRRGRKGNAAGDRRKTFQQALSKAADDADLPERWRPHDLRHRRVTTWLADNHSPALVQEAMGHADIKTTLQYTHLAREHLRSLVSSGPERKDLEELRG